MRISEQTLILLARTGDEQAIQVLNIVENNSSLWETELYFQPGPGIFYTSPVDSRKRTMMGMPAVTRDMMNNHLVGPNADRT